MGLGFNSVASPPVNVVGSPMLGAMIYRCKVCKRVRALNVRMDGKLAETVTWSMLALHVAQPEECNKQQCLAPTSL